MPRKAHPWFRTTAGRWYVTINGIKTPLPVTDKTDEAGAWDAFKTLLDKALSEKQAARKETVASLIPAYLESLPDKDEPPNAKSIRGYASCLRRFSALFGERCIGDIDAKSVGKRAAEEGWSDSHRANYLWVVQAFMRWAGIKEFSIRRPAKESRGAEAVISEEVYHKILRETTGDFHQLMRLLWVVGSRPMESGSLTAEMIDWTSGTVTLKKHKTQRHAVKRILYLNTPALAILREQADRYKEGPLFRGLHGQALSLQSVMTRMIRLSARIGHHVTAGMFRHTFATRALAAGVPDVHVAALLGHTSTRMIHKHYGHIHANARLLRETAEKISEAA